jgi:hypothetical protein
MFCSRIMRPVAFCISGFRGRVQGSDRREARTRSSKTATNESILNLAPGKRRVPQALCDTVCYNDTLAGINLPSSVLKEEVLPLLAGEISCEDSVQFEQNEHDST